ncbi:MAG: baseplate J/gp47 family protein [Treponema sp.]|jgi:uncharacterized phage protein gp47/JayE|nr:baseplate J/gp47 family protein [Treponema sp.]
MPFKRDSLGVMLDRIYANYVSLFKPLDKTPRQNLLKVFSAVDAGIYHQLLGDLDFFSHQLFPDTATGAYLREHWSIHTPPLHAIAANGNVIISGLPNKPVPVGIVFKSIAGKMYYTENSYKLGTDGTIIACVKAQDTGLKTNLAEGEELQIISAIPAGIDSKAVVASGGILGGTDAETDEEYLIRVLLQLRNPSRYGKKDDFASWAIDASPEVSAAWEFKNFGVFGAVLIQVINGNQMNGVSPVQNISEIKNYINEVAPPILFEVRTPEIINLNPTVALPTTEDSQENRELSINRMKTYMQILAHPGVSVTAGALRTSIIDGVAITDATVKIGGSVTGIMPTTILQYPYIGAVTWD